MKATTKREKYNFKLYVMPFFDICAENTNKV